MSAVESYLAVALTARADPEPLGAVDPHEGGLDFEAPFVRPDDPQPVAAWESPSASRIGEVHEGIDLARAVTPRRGSDARSERDGPDTGEPAETSPSRLCGQRPSPPHELHYRPAP